MTAPLRHRTTDETYADFAEALEAANKIRFAMAVTQAGMLEARPLTTQAADPDGVLWFFISASGGIAHDVAGRPDLLLIYSDPHQGRYLSLSGRASIVQDPARAKRLWSNVDQTFFDGPDDPDLRLLRVDITQIELWEPQGTRLGQFLKMAAAALGADVKPDDLGRHDRLPGLGRPALPQA